jgi:hypothetical protein
LAWFAISQMSSETAFVVSSPAKTSRGTTGRTTIAMQPSNGAAADPAAVASAWGTSRSDVCFAERFVGETPVLEVTVSDGESETISLRDVLVHMIAGLGCD